MSQAAVPITIQFVGNRHCIAPLQDVVDILGMNGDCLDTVGEDGPIRLGFSSKRDEMRRDATALRRWCRADPQSILTFQ